MKKALRPPGLDINLRNRLNKLKDRPEPKYENSNLFPPSSAPPQPPPSFPQQPPSGPPPAPPFVPSPSGRFFEPLQWP